MTVAETDQLECPTLRSGLAAVAESSRAESRDFAERAVQLTRVADLIPRFLNDHRGATPWTCFLREVAVARRISDRAAIAEVGVATGLVRRLPQAFSLLQEGRLPVAQAKVIAEETADCDAEIARAVDEQVAQRACTLAAWKLRDEVKRQLLRLDADAAAASSAKAAAQRDVEVVPLRDDQAMVTMTGPAEAIAAWWAQVDAEARRQRAAGDPRALGALRFDLAMASTPPSTAVPPAGLLADPERYTDCRLRRPFQLLVHVPVDTALGLGNEPGWLEGIGWISAPRVRQLLPIAELRQVCVTRDGQVVDLADRAERPPPTPEGSREALVRMATRAFSITEKTWRTEWEHDPSDALRDFVAVRDRFCDGPTQARVPAVRADLDHVRPHPEGPTAAWNLRARSRRTHLLKHAGWTGIDTVTGTLWISPAGQLVEVDRATPAPTPLDLDAELPDAEALHALETELLRPLRPDEEPPTVLPRVALRAELPDDPPF